LLLLSGMKTFRVLETLKVWLDSVYDSILSEDGRDVKVEVERWMIGGGLDI
jgi:hypothetical protein